MRCYSVALSVSNHQYWITWTQHFCTRSNPVRLVKTSKVYSHVFIIKIKVQKWTRIKCYAIHSRVLLSAHVKFHPDHFYTYVGGSDRNDKQMEIKTPEQNTDQLTLKQVPLRCFSSCC